MSQQCRLTDVNRATVYAQKQLQGIDADEEELTLLRLLDEEYTRHPFYGSRRMRNYLRKKGYCINRKRVQRLMQTLGLVGMAPGPNTSVKHPQHKIYPYLLRGVSVTRPNQVWSTDVTYIRLAGGFVYLVAVIDWYSRKVLSWRLSNTLDAGFCIEGLEQALSLFGKPEIFNTDQGVQFTSDGFIQVLKEAGIEISMDGRGRALDNIFVERLWRSVKYEDIYLKDYANVSELLLGLREYFAFYNGERLHQSLGYETPDTVYQTGRGGGASITDKFSRNSTLEIPSQPVVQVSLELQGGLASLQDDPTVRFPPLPAVGLGKDSELLQNWGSANQL
jgi:putative transposase